MIKAVIPLSAALVLALAVPGTAQQSQAPAKQQSQQTQPMQRGTQDQAGARAPERLSFYDVRDNDLMASDLIGTRVYNTRNENIGEVEDLILDNNKDVKALIIGVGGFLGVGERNVAVEPSSVMIQRQSGDADDYRIVMNATKENLTGAPEYKRGAQYKG